MGLSNDCGRDIKVQFGARIIAANAFFRRSLSSVELPTTVTRIDSRAFCGCQYIDCLVLPPSVETVKSFAFGAYSGDKGVKSVVVPSSVKRIEKDAFWDKCKVYYCGSPEEWNEKVKSGDYPEDENGQVRYFYRSDEKRDSVKTYWAFTDGGKPREVDANGVIKKETKAEKKERKKEKRLHRKYARRRFFNRLKWRIKSLFGRK